MLSEPTSKLHNDPNLCAGSYLGLHLLSSRPARHTPPPFSPSRPRYTSASRCRHGSRWPLPRTCRIAATRSVACCIWRQGRPVRQARTLQDTSGEEVVIVSDREGRYDTEVLCAYQSQECQLRQQIRRLHGRDLRSPGGER